MMGGGGAESAGSFEFDFDRVIERRGSDSEKWTRYAGTGDPDVIPLWVADMDFASPPCVLAALRERVDHGVFGYPQAPPELVETVVGMLAREHAWPIQPEWLVWLPGLVSGLTVTCRAIGQAGDEVLSFTPVYPPFLKVPRAVERRVVTAPLVQKAGEDSYGSPPWTMDFAALAAAVTPRTRLLLLCSPHNPVGRVWRRDELEQLAEFCLERDIVICSDEIHNQLVLDDDRPHLVTALLGSEVAARSITLLAPSKTYNIAGLGCSVAVISDETLRRRFRRAMAGIVPGVNLLGYTAALAAYRDGESWRRALLDYLRRGRDLVAAAVAPLPGLSMAHVEATYLGWIDARPLGHDDPAAFFREHGLAFSDGADFGAPGFVRINFGTRHALLREAMDRLQLAVESA